MSYDSSKIVKKTQVNPLFGALFGDFIGSPYEFHNIKTKKFSLVHPPHPYKPCRFTDDSMMTLATAEAIVEGDLDFARHFRDWGRRYPHAGFGGHFRQWLKDPHMGPYNSFGNGSAMRVSPVGYLFDTEAEVLEMARESAIVSHNHPEGIKGAQAIALAIFMARCGADKATIKQEIADRFQYDMNFTLDEIRPYYTFDETCPGSVPQSLVCFFESTDYVDAVRNAVSIGGDCDTTSAIAGSIALAYYGTLPEKLEDAITDEMSDDMVDVLVKVADKYF